MGKGEIALNEQFLLISQCFQKACTAYMLKPGFVWERVNTLNKWLFEYIGGKGKKTLVTSIFYFSSNKFQFVRNIYLFGRELTPSPNVKISYPSKLKAFGDNKTNVTHK